MKVSRNLLVALAALAALSGAVLAAEGKVFGAGLTEATVVPIHELVAGAEKYVGQRVRVEGKITDVCPKRGCWIDIAAVSGDTIRFKVGDGEIVFPLDVKDRSVRAEGVLTRIELTAEEAVGWMRHLAEERGATFDPASVTGPKTLYQIQGSGAVVN